MTILQNFIWNSPEAHAVPELYFRTQSRSKTGFDDVQSLRLVAGSNCTFDTYFNAFSVRPWRTKCAVEDLHFSLCGTGDVKVSIFHRTAERTVLLTDVTASLNEAVATQVEITGWPSLSEGFIFVELQAQTDTYITKASFGTDTAAPNSVRLGIVVTHFKRKPYVLPAIERISNQLLSNCDISDGLSLIVVDNSRDIAPEESGKATLIPNQNLGGSGGFTRGLLHLIDNDFSHCLFMDDDASCEMDSIYRTYRLLQYAKDDRLAVSGSMLMEHNLFETYEVGATMRKGIGFPLCSGLDLRAPADLSKLINLDTPIDYAGWWHFAFKINKIKKMPFPFFVKGDDQLFSIANDFDIIHLNGITVWAESFDTKDTPFSKYLYMRATLMLFSWDRVSVIRSIKHYYRAVRSSLFAFDYAGARAYFLSAEHFLAGPNFWTSNMDMSKIFPVISSITSPNQIVELGEQEITAARQIASKSKRETILRNAIRKLTLNGHLLPRFMLSRQPTVLHGHYNTDAKHTFGHQAAIQIIKEPNLGFKLTMNKRQFFSLYVKGIWLALKLAFKMKGLRRDYAKAMPEIMTEEFWRSVYDLPKGQDKRR